MCIQESSSSLFSLLFQDEANGKHLGTWSPGFPDLHVHQNSPISGSKVQCSLIFMVQGLEKILEDQSTNLNPGDVSLHRHLSDTIFSVNMLATCLRSILGGECSSQPSPPVMPKYAFQRKQWSHTLLTTAKHYLAWLESKLEIYISKGKGKNNIKRKLPQHLTYLEGSGYLLQIFHQLISVYILVTVQSRCSSTLI